LGLVHKLEWDAKLKEFVREAGDNDGGYSCDYLAAQAYRYAVTKDPEARREAVNAFHTIRWFEVMTGIKGFPARAVWARAARSPVQHAGGAAAEWHDTRTDCSSGRATSSDDFTHCTPSPSSWNWRRRAKKSTGEIFSGARCRHLMDHGWQLIDVDGKPTLGRGVRSISPGGGGNAARGDALEILLHQDRRSADGRATVRGATRNW
jgi:hypothetical protein